MNNRLNIKAKFLLTSVLTGLALPAFAHHSFSAEFDANKEVTLVGTVKKMEWSNPHTWLHIDVPNEKGEIEEWKVEGGAPGVLLRLGWTRDSLPPGLKVTVKGYMAKDGSHRANTRTIEFPDGRTMDMGSSGTRDKAKNDEANAPK